MKHPRAQLDDLLLHPVRFSILALLHHVAKAEFAAVRDAVEVSDSVLSKQLSVLEGAGYVAVEKRFLGKRPNTRLSLTARGREVFATHLEALQAVVNVGLPAEPHERGAARRGEA
ncbi:winged helix-turn-helix domain-containing protein [Truepera radiovictrix]|uniref:Transcriptional regulator, MarR/EmrR family protein n=1 Tax=Truepera radiovictrix (strain DSM 17093 / CIP 108686 / LMG 22925 / RQ-24) TaxID=649638 RepID=D7CR71_TRURR|nr:transcriptional regulator [Truepera radiovictrix]ADI15159.1 transcriptional regulator, MarR/EmrR family protein [Truepera radiovictrix DSM 17093]WMT56288.1 transcriptional regulator [Truepera radiovictrix]